TFLRATELGPVSIIAPIGNTGVLLPVVYGLVKGDPLRAAEAAGIVLAIGGAVLAARVPERPDDPHRPVREYLGYAVAGAVGFGVLLVALPPASEHGRFWALLDARAALVVFLVALLIGRRASPRVPRSAVPPLAVPGVLLVS